MDAVREMLITKNIFQSALKSTTNKLFVLLKCFMY